MMNGKILLATVVLSLGACASGPKDQMAAAPGATVCEDPRPQVCTMDYRPVCGRHEDGSVKTYSNGCGACSNPEVTSWVDGACAE